MSGDLTGTGSELASLHRQLAAVRENLRLIQERKSQYVMGTDVPLQLIKEEQQLLERIKELEQRIRRTEPATAPVGRIDSAHRKTEGGKANLTLWAFVALAIIGCIGITVGTLPSIVELWATARAEPTAGNTPVSTPSPQATVTTQALSTPTLVPTEQPPVAEPQVVDWVPYDSSLGTGMRVIGSGEFIPWEELKDEIVQGLLTQVWNIPSGSTVALADYNGMRDLIMQVIDPGGNVVANVWIGVNPLKGWDFDGLVRVGSPVTPPEVWGTFQRYSDGSYRRY